LKIALAILGAGAGEGSIRTWCRDHRAHHRYVDSDMDPYSVHRGLFYAHYGWVIFKRKREQTGPVNVQDLTTDKIVIWQRQHYTLLLITTAFIFPTIVSGLLFNDYLGGFIYASCLRLFLIQQSTFCINSLAHWMGERPFSGQHSPRDSWLVALITFGEGYHNFHHEFPKDYRNGYRWVDYDPTKWFIWICARVNLAYDLKRFPRNEIQKGHFQQVEKRLETERRDISWGIPVDQLPVLCFSEYTECIQNGLSLILIDGVAHDVSRFMMVHPGGADILQKHIGKDATKLFRGEIYAHSNAARNLLSTIRYARVIRPSYQES
jgi:stearoyl-CoA desaturase (delta-9 desaturase)